MSLGVPRRVGLSDSSSHYAVAITLLSLTQEYTLNIKSYEYDRLQT